MINHKITEGLSTIYKYEGPLTNSLFGESGGILDYLVSTPAIMAIIIEASASLLDTRLPEGYITVGKDIELSHDKPTIIDGTISIVLTVTKVAGEKIFLDVSGHDNFGQVCRGKYERVIVSQSELMESAYRRAHNTLE